MVIIMLGISSYNNPRLYISYRECKIDEGLDVYNRKEYEEKRKRLEKMHHDEVIRRVNAAEEIGMELLNLKFAISTLVMDDIVSRYVGGYPEIVKRAMAKITVKAEKDDAYEGDLIDAKKLEKFIMDKSLNEIGDGWQCLSKKQSAARDLLEYIAER